MERVSSPDSLSYRVLSPAGLQKGVVSSPLADRMTDPKGKTVYCVSQVVMGADILLGRVAKLLPSYAPGVKAVFKRKPAAYMTDEPEFWDEIASEADAVVYGCGA